MQTLMNSDCFDYHYSSLNTKPSVNRLMITILESISSVDFLKSIKIAKGWKTLLQRTLEINDSLAITSLQANSFKSNCSCLWSHEMRTLISCVFFLFCFFLFKRTPSFCNHRILILCSTRSLKSQCTELT